jgi:hypothetical protein
MKMRNNVCTFIYIKNNALGKPNLAEKFALLGQLWADLPLRVVNKFAPRRVNDPTSAGEDR